MANSEKGPVADDYKRIPRAQIETMGAAELKAVATDRGYQLPDQGGARTTRRRFIEAQNADSRLAPEEAPQGEQG